MNNDSEKPVRFLVTVIGLFITIGGLIWAISAQNQKLEATYVETQFAKVKSDINEKKIMVIETKLDYITKGIDDIKREVKKQ